MQNLQATAKTFPTNLPNVSNPADGSQKAASSVADTLTGAAVGASTLALLGWGAFTVATGGWGALALPFVAAGTAIGGAATTAAAGAAGIATGVCATAAGAAASAAATGTAISGAASTLAAGAVAGVAEGGLTVAAATTAANLATAVGAGAAGTAGAAAGVTAAGVAGGVADGAVGAGIVAGVIAVIGGGVTIYKALPSELQDVLKGWFKRVVAAEEVAYVGSAPKKSVYTLEDCHRCINEARSSKAKVLHLKGTMLAETGEALVKAGYDVAIKPNAAGYTDILLRLES